MNKALLDTDTISEIGKGVDPNVARNAAAYRKVFGHYTLSAVTVMEVVRAPEETECRPSDPVFGFDRTGRSDLVRPSDVSAGRSHRRGSGARRPAHRDGRYDDRGDCRASRLGVGYR